MPPYCSKLLRAHKSKLTSRLLTKSETYSKIHHDMLTEGRIGKVEVSVRVAGAVIAAATGAAGVEFTRQLFEALNNSTPVVETAEDCETRARIKHQIFRDKGGPTFPDGKPRFQSNIDEILGTAQNQRFLVEALGQSQVKETNQDGESFVKVRGKSNSKAGNLDAIKFRVQNLQNGDSEEFAIPCGAQVTNYVTTNESSISNQALNRFGKQEKPRTNLERTPAPGGGDASKLSPTPTPTFTLTPTPTATVIANPSATSTKEATPTPTRTPILPGPSEPRPVEGGVSWIVLGMGAFLLGLAGIGAWYWTRRQRGLPPHSEVTQNADGTTSVSWRQRLTATVGGLNFNVNFTPNVQNPPPQPPAPDPNNPQNNP